MDFTSSNNTHSMHDSMDFHRPSSTLSSVDRKPSAFSFDDSSTLDSNILDTPVLMSPTTSTQGIFSPDTSIWEDFSAGQFVDRTASSSVVNHNGNNPFFTTEQSNNPFARLPPNQAATYGQQTSWPVSDNSGSRTPTASKPMNPFGPGDFDSAPSTFVPAPSQLPYHGLPMHSNVSPTSVFPNAPEQPMSPHTNSEWMAFNQQEMDARPGPKRMRPNSPHRSFSPRRDGGIRKKNARFEIPAERNLCNIDTLIANCSNEDEMKELKQQKRLLRNRQAALDSRQRKKKHTEMLEEEKKVWSDKLCQLQDDFASVRIENDALLQEKENWHREHMEMQHMIQQLHYDKEELVRVHTLETGELRKKVSVLTERLECASSAMSVAPSSTFTDFASEMDNLNMGHNEWDNYIFVNDFAVDEQTPGPQQQEQSLVVAPRGKDEDKPVASGLLLMLLLCGAFVASKSAGSSAPPIPRMPDEVRAASATVLDSIFKDAGVSTALTEQGLFANHVSGIEPTSTGVNWAKTTLSGADLASMSGSSLDQMHAQLSNPTKDQEHEQLFSITPAQYNSMNSMDYTRNRYSMGSDDFSDPMSPDSQPPSHRRNLAETLAAMREQSKGDSAAEIYTRSLLWDKIAPEVVHEFKRMVEESAAASSRPSSSHGNVHKVESLG